MIENMKKLEAKIEKEKALEIMIISCRLLIALDLARIIRDKKGK